MRTEILVQSRETLRSGRSPKVYNAGQTYEDQEAVDLFYALKDRSVGIMFEEKGPTYKTYSLADDTGSSGGNNHNPSNMESFNQILSWLQSYSRAGLNDVMAAGNVEPPIKGLSFFKDSTGEYWWDAQKGAYQHFNLNQNGDRQFAGYYSVTGAGPKGQYTIVEMGKPYELAIRDNVKETQYTDVYRESVDQSVTLSYGNRSLISSRVITRPVGVKNTRTFNGFGYPIDNKWGLTGKVSNYTETRAYGTHFNSSANSAVSTGIGWSMLKLIPGIFGK